MKTTILTAALLWLASPALANKSGEDYERMTFDYRQMNWDYERMSVMVASGDCFRDMPVFDIVNYTEYCGADYMQRTLEEAALCQRIVDRYDDELRRYNDLRRKCGRAGSNKD